MTAAFKGSDAAAMQHARAVLRAALEHGLGNVRATGKYLGVGKSTVERWLIDYPVNADLDDYAASLRRSAEKLRRAEKKMTANLGRCPRIHGLLHHPNENILEPLSQKTLRVA